MMSGGFWDMNRNVTNFKGRKAKPSKNIFTIPPLILPGGSTQTTVRLSTPIASPMSKRTNPVRNRPPVTVSYSTTIPVSYSPPPPEIESNPPSEFESYSPPSQVFESYSPPSPMIQSYSPPSPMLQSYSPQPLVGESTSVILNTSTTQAIVNAEPDASVDKVDDNSEKENEGGHSYSNFNGNEKYKKRDVFCHICDKMIKGFSANKHFKLIHKFNVAKTPKPKEYVCDICDFKTDKVTKYVITYFLVLSSLSSLSYKSIKFEKKFL